MKFSRLIQVGVAVGGTLAASTPIPEDIKKWPCIVSAATYAAVLAVIRPKSVPAVRAIVISLSLGLVAGLVCFWITPTKTIAGGGKHYVKGELLPEARAVIEERHITEWDYFDWNGKKPDETWTPESLGKNTFIVALCYSVYVAALAFGLLGILEYLATPSVVWKWVSFGLAVALLFAGYFYLFKGKHGPSQNTRTEVNAPGLRGVVATRRACDPLALGRCRRPG